MSAVSVSISTRNILDFGSKGTDFFQMEVSETCEFRSLECWRIDSPDSALSDPVMGKNHYL